MNRARQFTAANLAALLFFLSPGLAPYQAVASGVKADLPSPSSSGRVIRLPALNTPTQPSIAAPPGASPAGNAPRPLAAAPETAESPAQVQKPAAPDTPLSRVEAQVSEISTEVSQKLEARGDPARARPSAEHALGEELQAELSGEPSETALSSSPDSPQGGGQVFARWAGQDSVESAVRASHTQPPAPPPDNPKRRDGGSGEWRVPVWLRLVSAGAALIPSILLSRSLFGSGVPVIPWPFAATAVSIAALPLAPQSPRLPPILRSMPTFLLVLTGGVAFMTGVSLLMAPLVFFAGLGLDHMISGLYDAQERRYRVDSPRYLAACGAALAAVSGLGIDLLQLRGAFPIAAGLAASAAVAWLIYQIPGTRSALKGFKYSMRFIFHALHFWAKETDFGKNLDAWRRHYTQRSLLFYPLFAPLWLWGQFAKWSELAIAVALGSLLGLLRVPALYWGANAYAASPQGRLSRFWRGPNGRWTRFLAGFNRSWLTSVEGSKTWLFDFLLHRVKIQMNKKDGVTSRPTAKAVWALLYYGSQAQIIWLAYVAASFFLSLPWNVFQGLRNAWGPKTPPQGGEPDPDSLNDILR